MFCQSTYTSKQPLGEEHSFVRIGTEATSATRPSFELESGKNPDCLEIYRF